MLNAIEPFYNPRNTCIENIYISICNALKRSFTDMYAYSWNFGYKYPNALKDNDLFGKRIMPGRDCQGLNSELHYALEKYCGVSPVWHINCEYKNFINIVKKELDNGRPVVIGTDIFYCNWHKASGKYHSIHFCLIIGMNENGFICIDDTLASNDGNLILTEPPKSLMFDFNTLSRFKFGFITFKINPTISEQSSDEMIYMSALKTITGIDGVSDYQRMRELLSDINNYLNIDKEIQGFEDAWAIDLVRCFNYLIWARINYTNLLEEKQKYMGIDIKTFSNKLTYSMNLWNGIRNYIMKYAVEPDIKFCKEMVCDSLNDIIKIEENLANEIVDTMST